MLQIKLKHIYLSYNYTQSSTHQTSALFERWGSERGWVYPSNRITHNYTYWSFTLKWSPRMHKLQVIKQDYITCFVWNRYLILLVNFINLNELIHFEFLSISPWRMKWSFFHRQLGIWIYSIEILSMALYNWVHMKNKSIMHIRDMKSWIPIMQMKEVIFTPSKVVYVFLLF